MGFALRHRQIPFPGQLEIEGFFEEEGVGLHRFDLVVGREIIVELKAVQALEDIHFAQVKSSFKETGLHAACS